MRARRRKLIGTVAMLALVFVYALLIMAIGAGRMVSAPPWAQLAFYLAAGLLWVVPAGALIWWMQRPDS